MPTNSSLKANLFSQKTCPRALKLAVLFFFTPLFFFGQTLTGLWTGALSNDSATVRKDQLFEIVLSEYKGKVTGFSRSEFIVDDTLYYIVKRVKGTIEGDICQVEDEEIVSYNFKGKLDKGVKVTSTFRRNTKDSSWYLDGTWKTNATKKYYSVSGKVNLQEEQDLNASKIFPHLEELNLANSVAFYKERNETATVVKIAKPEKVKTEYSSKAELEKASTPVTVDITQPGIQRAEVKTPAEEPEVIAYREGIKKQEAEAPRTDLKRIVPTAVSVNPTENNKPIALNPIPDMSAVVTPLNRPQNELPRTDTKDIPATTVSVNPKEDTKAIALNPVPDMSAVVTPLNRPQDELPRTDAKNIPVTTVMVGTTETGKSRAENKKPVTSPVPAAEPATNTGIASDKKENSNGTNNPVQNNRPAAIKNNTPPVASNSKPAEKNISVTSSLPVKPAENKAIVTTTNNKEEVKPVTRPQPAVTPTEAKGINSTVVNAPVINPPVRKPLEEIKALGASIAGRKTEFSQIVSFHSDSIEIALYDNGEIDGDTVSIYLNGQVVMSRQGLKASAIKKTIQITPGNEDFTLVLFAENLGKYPPNTGLLVVHDGDDVYNLRFSSDFQKNAGIIFRRTN